MCQTIKTSKGGMVASVDAITTLLGQVADMNVSNLSTALFRKRIQRCSGCMPGGGPPSGCWTAYFKRSKAPKSRRWAWRSVTLTSGGTSCLPTGKVLGSSVGYSAYEGGGCSVPSEGAEDVDGRPVRRNDDMVWALTQLRARWQWPLSGGHGRVTRYCGNCKEDPTDNQNSGTGCREGPWRVAECTDSNVERLVRRWLVAGSLLAEPVLMISGL